MADSCDKRDPLERDPVTRLFPVVRKQFRHPDFDQAAYDLEQLSRARYFVDQVPDVEEIAVRFREFIASLPANEEAINDVNELLTAVGKEVEKIRK